MTSTSVPEAPRKHTSRKPRSQKNPLWRTAANSDRHELYELAVQCPEAECDLIDQIWRERRGKTCRHIREDFCGTACVAMEWVKRRKSNTAVGVDIDKSVLDWGRKRIPQRLTTKEQIARLTLIHGDVLTTKTEPVDSVLAMNFSYYLFKTRETLRNYFSIAREAIHDDGLFLLDAYGGSDSFVEDAEERDLDGFTYIWDTVSYNPINGHVKTHIHFEFPDGSKMRKAFTYEWRLWTIPEIRELLEEAGFRKSWVYWEGTDEETNEGNGEWKVTRRGEACPGWIAYIAAEK